MKSKKGFTLVELVVVMAITAIFGGIVLMIATSSGKLFAMTQRDSIINDEARLGLSILTEDIRVGKNINCTFVDLDGTKRVKVNGINIVEDTSGALCSDIGFPVGRFRIILRCNVKGELIYYVKVGKDVQRMKLEGGIFKIINSFGNVESGGVSKNLSDATDKRYYINFIFSDELNNETPFETAIMPRN